MRNNFCFQTPHAKPVSVWVLRLLNQKKEYPIRKWTQRPYYNFDT